MADCKACRYFYEDKNDTTIVNGVSYKFLCKYERDEMMLNIRHNEKWLTDQLEVHCEHFERNKKDIEEKYKEFLEKMKNADNVSCYSHVNDREDWHRTADNILCDFLEYLGYKELVDAWDAIPKWYA